MDSALRPREIQARIRSGESLADVAERAGVPQERIEVYATPVYAERGHIATVAMTSSARRRGDASGHRNLQTVLKERLMARGIDVESVDWDAWKLPDRRWRVEARYAAEKSPVVALFTFDPAGRFSLAANDEARWLLGELSTARADERRDRDEDGEPTIDLDDEFALVRALGRNTDPGVSRDNENDAADENDVATNAEAEVEDERSAVDQAESSAIETTSRESPTEEQKPAKNRRGGRSRTKPQQSHPERRQAEPEPVPGAGSPDDVYDVLPTPESELDALYEMLGGFNEDSVNIYAGLNEPVTEPAPQERPREDGGDTSSEASTEPTVEKGTELGDSPEPADASGPSKSAPVVGEDGVEQPSLIEDENAPAPAKKPRANKKRASIPSWDEIMFGGPKP